MVSVLGSKTGYLNHPELGFLILLQLPFDPVVALSVLGRSLTNNSQTALVRLSTFGVSSGSSEIGLHVL